LRISPTKICRKVSFHSKVLSRRLNSKKSRGKGRPGGPFSFQAFGKMALEDFVKQSFPDACFFERFGLSKGYRILCFVPVENVQRLLPGQIEQFSRDQSKELMDRISEALSLSGILHCDRLMAQKGINKFRFVGAGASPLYDESRLDEQTPVGFAIVVQFSKAEKEKEKQDNQARIILNLFENYLKKHNLPQSFIDRERGE